MSGEELVADFPEKLQFLFEPYRYKIAYGGRGGIKSWTFARALLALAAERKLRILCCRDIQNSIEESVHALLEQQIPGLGLSAHYQVQDQKILGANGSDFFFAGLRHNINKIKSIEGIDIVWVEEAALVAKASWDVLIPTIRKPGSEIWVSFNPETVQDDTWKRFVVDPPTGARVVKLTWRDNPWFPEVLRIEKDDCLRKSKIDYDHIWEGNPKNTLTGAIYAAELKKARADGRVGKVAIDRTRPIDTAWDLGFGDTLAIWFFQVLPGGIIRLVDYLEGNGRTIAEYLIDLQDKKYLYGTDWLPHDGVDGIIHKKLTGDPSKSVEMLMRAAGRKVRIAPKLLVNTGINAARTVFPQCYFDEEKCGLGLNALDFYQWKPNTAEDKDPRPGVNSTGGAVPLHNWASHAADAFRTMALVAKPPVKEAAPAPPPQGSNDEHGWMG